MAPTKALIFLLLFSALFLRAQADYVFTPVDFPHTELSQPQGINDNGDIVGYHQDGLSPPQGFIRKDGTFTAITGRPGSISVIVYGINNSGQIVGNDSPGGQSAAFLLNDGVYSDVAYPGCSFNVAVAISNNGKILGECQLSGVSIMYVLSEGVYTKLPDPGRPAAPMGINNNGDIVGNFGGSAGFLYSGGIYTVIPGPPGSIIAQASGINDNGHISGYDQFPTIGAPGNQGFILSGGAYTVIQFEGQTIPQQYFGINNNDWVVGGFGFQAGDGFLGMPRLTLSVTSVTPNVVPAGIAFEMTVTGTGFLSTAVVQWNRTALSTTYISSTELNAFVPASLLASPSSYDVTVQNFGVAPTPDFPVRVIPATGPPLLIFTPPGLPVGHAGTPYSQTLVVGGGVAPYSWSLISGALPSGLSFSSSGVITGTPAVAETLSFTVQVTDAASSVSTQTYFVPIFPSTASGPAFIGSMPHIAAEENWTTTFTLVNKQPSASAAQLSFFGDAADASGNGPLSLPLASPQQSPASSLQQTVPANASLIVQTAGPQAPPVQVGSAQLAGTGDVDGFAIFHQIPTAQEAVVPMETRNAASYLLAFDNTNGLSLGVAVENVSTQAANIGVVLRDAGGVIIGTGTLVLSGGGHSSFALSTQFPITTGKQGTAEFDTPSGGRVSVLGIRFTPPNNALTTIPALANVGPGGGSIAHIATGNGWQTTFVLVNAGTAAAPLHLAFFADVTGSPLPLPLSFPQAGVGASTVASSVDQTLAAGATLLIESAAPLSDPTPTVGSAQLTTPGNVGGFVIFRFNPNGQEAVVPLESRNANGYIIAFDNTGGTATGIAINSVSQQSAAVPVVIRDETGAQIGADSMSMAANGHLAFTLGADKYPATANIRGTLEFDTPSGGEIGVLGIRIPASHTFTTLPALVR